MMKKLIKRIIIALVPKKIKTELALFRKITIDYGHFNSIKKGECIDRHDNPIPWYTYPTIEYLNQFDYSNKTIFEWGTGNSSLFWGRLAKKVISIEDNPQWFKKINSKKSTNMKLYLIQNEEEYVKIISKLNIKFDIIIIDAKFRQECVKIAPNFLKKKGIIIFDNSDRYPNTCKKLRENNNLIQIDFSGFGPLNSSTWTTSLFLDRNFYFNVKERQPEHSLGSLRELCE